MENSQLVVMSERFDRLERDHRRLKRFTALTLIAALALLVGVANSDDRPRTIEAEKIVLRGKDGKTRFLLELERNEFPNMTFFDKDGKSRLSMGIDSDFGTPGLDIQDENNKGAIRMGVTPFGVSTLTLTEPEGQQLALLAIGKPENCAELTFGHETKGTALRIMARPKDAFIAFMDKEDGRLNLGVDAEGAADLNVHDNAGNTRLTLGRKPDGSSFLKLLDQAGKVLFQSP